MALPNGTRISKTTSTTSTENTLTPTNQPPDCLTSTTAPPNTTQLSSILACQNAATTPYCYPPNGTRICIPSQNIPFYWPPGYYFPATRLALDYTPTPTLLTLLPNTGNTTQEFTLLTYQVESLLTSGLGNETVLKFYFKVPRDDSADAADGEIYDGPEVVLVRTDALSTQVRSGSATATAMATRRPSSSSSGDGDGLSRKEIGGIVVGIIAALILFGGCFVCCGVRAKKRSRQSVVQPMRQIEADATSAVRRRGSSESYRAAQESLPGARVAERDHDSSLPRHPHPESREQGAGTLPPYRRVEGDEEPPAYAP